MPLSICATPIGNLDDVTLRVLEELRAADLVLCEDTRRTRILLARHGSTLASRVTIATTRPLGRLACSSGCAGGACCARVRRRAAGVNDPGARLIAAAVSAEVDVSVLPGASAVETALVVSGLGADRYQFVGYLPRRAGELRTLAEAIGGWGGAVVAFESPRRLPSARARRDASGSSRRRVPRAHEALRGGRTRLAR